MLTSVELKIPLLELTHSQYCQAVLGRLGKGAQHAGLLYEQILRTGSPDRTVAAFANGQALVDAILEITDIALPAAARHNSDGATGKFLLATADALEIETVVIPMQSGGTLCVSSQIGCRMGCSFCETGRMGLLRNLSVAEIVGQVFVARHIRGADIRNVVFMGMGEPFDNYDNVMQAVRVLTDPHGFGFGKRNITVSTSGCADGIRRFTAEEGDTPNLAVSISAPHDELRNRLMPVNRKHNLAELHECMRAYNAKTGRQILIAYVLLCGQNDAPEHADKLADYLEGLDVKVNLIPYNPQSRDRYQPSPPEVLDAFTRRLRARGLYTLLRATKGQEIMAACGQLGNMELRKLRKKTGSFGYNEGRDNTTSINPNENEVSMSRKSKAAEFIEEGYNITVTGRNVQVTDSMKDYAIEKVSKVEKFVERIIDVNITMDIQRVEHRVDICLKINNVKIKSHAVSDNMYASIDLAVHKLETQLLKYKTRLHDHHVKNHAIVDMNVNVFAAPSEDEINDEIESENQRALASSFVTPKVISKEKRALRILNTNEAITKLELSGDRFLIFRSEEDRKLKVIYRRDDGSFGVIEVEA